ncbi:hypothetical protein GCM10010121_084650 [Streptomyces brasiliensis]|uniref:Uncharacterized protein n=1 Tax=Streptomyces brasiliensis TaxID=1954 RepID=A0A917P4G9_9ACTN|nr:hypothetical protein GCM10010121_084650 [Streptomyces brasiliensis]
MGRHAGADRRSGLVLPRAGSLLRVKAARVSHVAVAPEPLRRLIFSTVADGKVGLRIRAGWRCPRARRVVTQRVRRRSYDVAPVPAVVRDRPEKVCRGGVACRRVQAPVVNGDRQGVVKATQHAQESRADLVL